MLFKYREIPQTEDDKPDFRRRPWPAAMDCEIVMRIREVMNSSYGHTIIALDLDAGETVYAANTFNHIFNSINRAREDTKRQYKAVSG